MARARSRIQSLIDKQKLMAYLKRLDTFQQTNVKNVEK